MCSTELSALFWRLWEANVDCEFLCWQNVDGAWSCAHLSTYVFGTKHGLQMYMDESTVGFKAFLQDVLAKHNELRVRRKYVTDAPPDPDSSDDDECSLPHGIHITSSPIVATLFARLSEQFFQVAGSYKLLTYRSMEGVCAEDVSAFAWADFFHGRDLPQVNAAAAITQLFGNPLVVVFSAESCDKANLVETWQERSPSGEATWSVDCRFKDRHPTKHALLSASDALQIMLSAFEIPTFARPCEIACRLSLPFECTPAGVDALTEFVQAAGL